MAYFPLFIDLQDKKVLVVGAGEVALRKIEKLLPFNPKITVVAKKVKQEKVYKLAKEKKINLIERPFSFEDLKEKDLVIVAVDDINLQKQIYEYCKDKKIPVNSVDSPKFCSFIFPAYIKKADLIIGVSTSGKAPALAGKLKKTLEECLPENIEVILDQLEEIRKKLPKGKERQKLIKEKLTELLDY